MIYYRLRKLKLEMPDMRHHEPRRACLVKYTTYLVSIHKLKQKLRGQG